MAVNELQHRLEHLVSYSSQLIFVSGNSIAQQQKSLQAFLSHQSDNTEIAFINGEADATKQSYRKQIKEQLLGEEPGLFNRPLNELLAPLNHHDGPVLICLCQAEKIPSDFLQELWDLVLQSRFANNKQHLNVLLFAESEWAEQAKTWLPAKNRDKPVLLSTESILSGANHVSDLDRLIMEKRKQFELRKINQGPTQPIAKSVLSAIWFKGLIAAAFLMVFSGLMLWLYPVELSQLLASTPDQQPDSATAPPLIEPIIDNQITNGLKQTPVLLVDKQPELTTEITQQTNTESSEQTQPQQSEAATKTLLVSEWQSKESSNERVSNAQEPEQAIELPQLDSAPQLTSSNRQIVEDYQVADTPLDNTSEDSAPQESLMNSWDNAQVLALQPSAFVLQIAGLADQQTMLQYLADNQLSDRVWVYKTKRFGGDWYVILNRASYTSIVQARADINTLPPVMLQSTPFVKRVDQVQGEISTQ